jgi:hypothetical protein
MLKGKLHRLREIGIKNHAAYAGAISENLKILEDSIAKGADNIKLLESALHPKEKTTSPNGKA